MESQFPREGSIPEFLAALASPEDAHGGLAAAAIAGAMGASLLHRGSALPQSLADDDNLAAHVSVSGALARIQEELLETVETQTAVRLFAARNLPQANEAERETRARAVQIALRAAADVPLEVMRLCEDALRHAESVADRRRRRAAPEVELGVALLEAAFNAARSNLEAKLPILTDTSHVASIGEELARLSQSASAATDRVKALVRIPPT